MAKFQMQLGTTGKSTYPVGCWLDMDHYDDNGRRACRGVCTKCGHVIVEPDVSDRSIKRLFHRFREECPMKEDNQYGRVPAPEQSVVIAFQQQCMLKGIRYLKQARGQYRIPLAPKALALVSIVNAEQCCWRLAVKGRPKYTKWGTIEDLFAWLEGGKW